MIEYIVAFITVVLGGMCDSIMWGDRKEQPAWLTRYTDLIWLAGWNVYMPIMWMIVGALSLYSWTLIPIMFGMSVFWDLTYFKIESGVWVRPIRCWSVLPWYGPDRTFNRCLSVENKKLVIGFNSVKDMMWFNAFRVVVLLLTLL